jgi:hypothetical protein
MRTLLIISLAFLTKFAFGQAHITIEPIQQGTATMENGKTVIQLNAEVVQLLTDKSNSSQYTVSITPIYSYSQLYISEKDTTSFTVQQAEASNGPVSFDYIVYLKQPLPSTLNYSNLNKGKAPAAGK